MGYARGPGLPLKVWAEGRTSGVADVFYLATGEAKPRLTSDGEAAMSRDECRLNHIRLTQLRLFTRPATIEDP